MVYHDVLTREGEFMSSCALSQSTDSFARALPHRIGRAKGEDERGVA
jgi:hypothetical protein